MTSQPPVLLVLHGARGDLARRMVFPGLAELAQRDLLPERWLVLGTGRRPTDEVDLPALVREALAEHGDKVGADEKTAIETGLAELKTAREGTDPEDIRAKTNTLVQASMKLGEAMYAQQQGDAAAEGQPADDGVVDAEFEEVSDTDGDDKKSA